MFRAKKGPYILLLSLLAILIFILGLQYGKHIQKIDKTNEYILSLTPSVQPTPTIHEVTGYTTFSNKGCGISFLYPSNFILKKETSTEAQIQTANNNEGIYMQCDPSQIDEPKGASTEAQIASEDALLYKDSSSPYLEMRIRNSDNKLVQIQMLKELEPLISNSFSFVE